MFQNKSKQVATTTNIRKMIKIIKQEKSNLSTFGLDNNLLKFFSKHLQQGVSDTTTKNLTK